MKQKTIIVLVVLILAIAVFAGVNKSKNLQLQQNQKISPTQMPSVSPSQSPILSPTATASPIAGQTFEIRGAITSVSGSTFVVDGRTITINPSRVVNFQQTTGVTVGNQVKVEGIIDNGTFFAREIKSLAEDNSGSGSSGNN